MRQGNPAAEVALAAAAQAVVPPAAPILFITGFTRLMVTFFGFLAALTVFFRFFISRLFSQSER